MIAANECTYPATEAGLAGVAHPVRAPRGVPGDRVRRRLLRAAGAAAFALIEVGCASSAIPTRALPSAASAEPAACHPTGQPRVLARHVFVPGGIEAYDDGGAFSVRFATARSRCVAVEGTGSSPRFQAASCPGQGSQTATRPSGEGPALLAWESRDGDAAPALLGAADPEARAFLGYTGARSGRLLAAPSDGTASGAQPFATDVASLGHGRFLIAWVDGDLETSRVAAQSVAGSGDPLGNKMIFSAPEATVIGRPSVAIAPTGYGLVTYIASVNGEFDALATPIACAMN